MPGVVPAPPAVVPLIPVDLLTNSEGNSRLKPPVTGNDAKQVSGSIAGNWKGSMESLHKRAEATKEKVQSHI